MIDPTGLSETQEEGFTAEDTKTEKDDLSNKITDPKDMVEGLTAMYKEGPALIKAGIDEYSGVGNNFGFEVKDVDTLITAHLLQTAEKNYSPTADFKESIYYFGEAEKRLENIENIVKSVKNRKHFYCD